MSDIVPTRTLASQGVAAVVGIGGGAGLAALNMLTHGIPIVGIIVGGVITLVGIGALSSRDPADKRGGLITLAAGGLTILSRVPFFAGFAGSLMNIAVIGLLGSGIWNAIKFIKGLKSRS